MNADAVDPLEIRRIFLKDSEWERTSESWKALKPLRDFNQLRESDETVQEYCLRLRPRFNIPLEVAAQWLYGLYYNAETTNNYGWIDYDRVIFEESKMPIGDLAALNIIKQYEPYVRSRESSTPFDKFACILEDKEHWQKHKTWRVPPIVIDVSTLSNIPDYAEINGRFQLVEGHSRLGYLLAMRRVGLLDKEYHSVFRLYVRNNIA